MRVSFVGGGTDLPAYYERRGGAVVSTSIDKWIHVVVAPRFEGDLRVSYSRTEIVDRASEVEHELVREALRMTGLARGLDVITLADVPARGTGLGSSSAVTVGLLNALYAYQGVAKSARELAAEACEIEISILGKPIGQQDQYAAALGGFNFMEFLPAGARAQVEPIVCPPDTLLRVHRSLLLFYTGRQRADDDVLEAQQEAIRNGSATKTLDEMRALAHELRERLAAGDAGAVGPLVRRDWELKRSLAHGISDAETEGWHDRALDAGATGGKLLGAGAGGFLLLVAPPERQRAVRGALSELREVPFNFSARGSEIQLLER